MKRRVLHDRLVWQCASLLLDYPDDRRLDDVDALLPHLEGSAAEWLSRTAAAVRKPDRMRVTADYVDTFDLRRRTTMYLTYWTAGDTRNRGSAMLEFAAAYQAAGQKGPSAEAPDYLPVVLEFAARIDPVAGRRLLSEHRVPIAVLHDALSEARSPYRHAVAAVLATLPQATDTDTRRAKRLAEAGPPTEAVGLQPFTLTVPPRRGKEPPDAG
jgi:nitrate reductase delta subunit